MNKNNFWLLGGAISLLVMGLGCDAPATDTTSTWSTYQNQELGFELKMPPTVLVDKVFNDKDNRLVIFKSAQENFEVRLQADAATPLSKYYYLGFPVATKALLGGQEAVVFEAPIGYCDGPGCGSPFVAYSTKRGVDFYNLVFSGDVAMSDTEKLILASFKFITPTPTQAAASSQVVRVFFNNTKFDPGLTDCSQVYPVKRTITPTQAVARAALEELFKGLAPGEKELGYLTNLNSGVRIQKLTIANGVAQVDFSADLEKNGGGSCRTAAIIAQIKETLKQFPTVQNVIISIDGRTEDILQP